MNHARFPNFSQPAPSLTIEHVPFAADPILAAIDHHSETWAVFQVAVGEEPSLQANDAMDAALVALLGTPCATRFGGLALLRHLRWWLGEEAAFAESYQPEYGQAQARASDLLLFLGSELPPVVMPTTVTIGQAAALVVRRLPSPRGRRGMYLPLRLDAAVPENEDAPGSIEPWEAVTPIRPDTAHVRSMRLLDGMGEAFAALFIVLGGVALVGLATLA